MMFKDDKCGATGGSNIGKSSFSESKPRHDYLIVLLHGINIKHNNCKKKQRLSCGGYQFIIHYQIKYYSLLNTNLLFTIKSMTIYFHYFVLMLTHKNYF